MTMQQYVHLFDAKEDKTNINIKDPFLQTQGQISQHRYR